MERPVRRRYKKKKTRFISQCEAKCHQTLTFMGLDPMIEVRISGLPRLRFDFYFVYQGRPYLLEYDGDQHFEFCEFIQKYPIRFRRCQQHDILKTTVALLKGYWVIRLDDRTVKNHLQDHIMRALQSGERLYFSNPGRYQWLAEAVVPEERILKYGGDFGPEIISRATTPTIKLVIRTGEQT